MAIFEASEEQLSLREHHAYVLELANFIEAHESEIKSYSGRTSYDLSIGRKKRLKNCALMSPLSRY